MDNDVASPQAAVGFNLQPHILEGRFRINRCNNLLSTTFRVIPLGGYCHPNTPTPDTYNRFLGLPRCTVVNGLTVAKGGKQTFAAGVKTWLGTSKLGQSLKLESRRSTNGSSADQAVIR